MFMTQSGIRPSADEIEKRAYFLWEQEGKVEGRDVEYWLQAEAQLVASQKQEVELQSATAKLSSPPPKQAPKAKSKNQPQFA